MDGEEQRIFGEARVRGCGSTMGSGLVFGVSLVSSCSECNCDLVIDECLSKNILRVCLPGTSFCLLFQGTPYLRFLCLFGY